MTSREVFINILEIRSRNSMRSSSGESVAMQSKSALAFRRAMRKAVDPRCGLAPRESRSGCRADEWRGNRAVRVVSARSASLQTLRADVIMGSRRPSPPTARSA